MQASILALILSWAVICTYLWHLFLIYFAYNNKNNKCERFDASGWLAIYTYE